MPPSGAETGGEGSGGLDSGVAGSGVAASGGTDADGADAGGVDSGGFDSGEADAGSEASDEVGSGGVEEPPVLPDPLHAAKAMHMAAKQKRPVIHLIFISMTSKTIIVVSNFLAS